MTAVETRPEVDWRRLNSRMLLVHPVVEVARALPAIVAALLAGHGTNAGTVWATAIAVIVAAIALVRWFTTRYRITGDRVELRRGLLRRRTLTAPLDRVRTVDVTSHLLHRLLGLARVAIGTGTSDREGRGQGHPGRPDAGRGSRAACRVAAPQPCSGADGLRRGRPCPNTTSRRNWSGQIRAGCASRRSRSPVL